MYARSTPNKQRGAALIIGLILLAIITLLAVVGMNISNSELSAATSEQLRMRAFQAAETGVERGLAGLLDIPTSSTAEVEGAVTPVEGAPTNPDDEPIDHYQTRSQYRGESNLVDGYGKGFGSFHFTVVSEGTSARNAIAEHTQGAYIVNQTGGQETYAPLPVAAEPGP
jgi:type II secretory pathway pseudopilin PulG